MAGPATNSACACELIFVQSFYHLKHLSSGRELGLAFVVPLILYVAGNALYSESPIECLHNRIDLPGGHAFQDLNVPIFLLGSLCKDVRTTYDEKEQCCYEGPRIVFIV